MVNEPLADRRPAPTGHRTPAARFVEATDADRCVATFELLVQGIQRPGVMDLPGGDFDVATSGRVQIQSLFERFVPQMRCSAVVTGHDLRAICLGPDRQAAA